MHRFKVYLCYLSNRISRDSFHAWSCRGIMTVQLKCQVLLLAFPLPVPMFSSYAIGWLAVNPEARCELHKRQCRSGPSLSGFATDRTLNPRQISSTGLDQQRRQLPLPALPADTWSPAFFERPMFGWPLRVSGISNDGILPIHASVSSLLSAQTFYILFFSG